MARTKEQHAAYMRKRYHKIRADAVVHLGGRCAKCGSTVDLEIDHVDPKLKTMDVGRLWSASKAKYEAEIQKCQLLCRECHQAKTLVDMGRKSARTEHGTLSAYRYCRCPECVAAYNEYQKLYKRKRRRQKILEA